MVLRQTNFVTNVMSPHACFALQRIVLGYSLARCFFLSTFNKHLYKIFKGTRFLRRTHTQF